MGELQTIFFLRIFPNFSQWLHITLVIEKKSKTVFFNVTSKSLDMKVYFVIPFLSIQQDTVCVCSNYLYHAICYDEDEIR